jgi:hypothetical protein
MSVFKTIGKPSANRVESRPVECKGLTAYNRSMRAKLDVKSVDDVMKLTIEDVGSELPFELSLTSDDFGATTFNSAKTPWNANSMGEAVFMGITHVFSKHEREPGMWPYVKGGASINRKWSKTVTMKGIAGITTGKVWERRYLLCERITERSAIPTLSVFAPASPWELYQQAEGWMAGVYATARCPATTGRRCWMAIRVSIVPPARSTGCTTRPALASLGMTMPRSKARPTK